MRQQMEAHKKQHRVRAGDGEDDELDPLPPHHVTDSHGGTTAVVDEKSEARLKGRQQKRGNEARLERLQQKMPSVGRQDAKAEPRLDNKPTPAPTNKGTPAATAAAAAPEKPWHKKDVV